MATIQESIDRFLITAHLKSVSDIIYFQSEEIVKVLRDSSKGRKNFDIDVSTAASPLEVVEIIRCHSAVY